MTNKEAPHDNDNRPAVGGPVQRMVRAPHPERAAFEAWALPILGDNPTWRESGSCELAWQAWQAARPQRAAVGPAGEHGGRPSERERINALLAAIRAHWIKANGFDSMSVAALDAVAEVIADGSYVLQA